MDLDGTLRKALDQGASDIHLKVPLPPVIRVNGQLAPMRGEARLTPDEIRRIADYAIFIDHGRVVVAAPIERFSTGEDNSALRQFLRIDES